jgi:hypothetical protein
MSLQDVRIWGETGQINKSDQLLSTHEAYGEYYASTQSTFRVGRQEIILLADRVIPLKPGPKATLGTVFPIEFKRPRDKATINADENFKKERNAINSYLMELGKFRSASNKKVYHLPQIEPQLPRQKKAIV